MTCKKLVTILRYISLFLMLISIINYKNNLIFLIILFTLVLINNQLRLFKLYTDERLVLLSLLVELIFCGFITVNLQNSSTFFILPCIMDAIFLLTKDRSKISLIIIILSFLLLQIPLTAYRFLENLLTIAIILLFCLYIKQESESKAYIYHLSNKLKESENKLKATTKTIASSNNLSIEIDTLKEKNKHARNLYSSISNSLSATLVQLSAIEHIAIKEQSKIEPLSKDLKNFVNNIYSDIKKESKSLRLASDPNDWLDRIEELCKNFSKITNILVSITLSENQWSLNSNQASVIYKIVKDSLSNSLKYGYTQKINIFLNFNKSDLSITIQDNCSNCDIDKIRKSPFFTSIIDKVSDIGGLSTYSFSGTKSYTITLTLPRSKQK